MSSESQTSSPTDAPVRVEDFLSHNAAALIILFPFAILLLAALAKGCLLVSSRADGPAAGPAEKHASADWVSDLHLDGAELGCQTCGVVKGSAAKPPVGSAEDAAVVGERAAAGYDGAYRGH